MHLAYFSMISRGNCWLTVEGAPDPFPLTGGDCFLTGPRASYTLRDALHTPARSLCGAMDGKSVIEYGGGGAPTTIVSGLLNFETPSVKPMAQLLPNLILIRADQTRTAALHSTLQMLASEMIEGAPGSEVAANRLAEVLFIQTIRAHIASGGESCQRGWLSAIFDPQIGSTLKSIHQNVRHPWTVESLASSAGMSRSAFAARFKELLGQTPLDYVTGWRMQKAIQLFEDRDAKLAEVALAVGYESGAAFSKAFKRAIGAAPGEYRRNALNGAGPTEAGQTRTRDERHGGSEVMTPSQL
jgi:AraC-like DNA-binding protein